MDDKRYDLKTNVGIGDVVQWTLHGPECRAARSGWNGKGQFILAVVPPADLPIDDAETGLALPVGSEDLWLCGQKPFWVMKNAVGLVFPWTPNMLDCFAFDWELWRTTPTAF